MPYRFVVWDLDDDVNGNVQHCAQHDVTKQEVEEVLESSGRLAFFGDTSTGRHLLVVCDELDANTVYPVTAYEVPRRRAS